MSYSELPVSWQWFGKPHEYEVQTSRRRATWGSQRYCFYCIIIIIIIIIIIMCNLYAGYLYTWNHISMVCKVAAILYGTGSVVVHDKYFILYITTFRSICALPNMAIVCRCLISCFLRMFLRYFLNYFEMVIHSYSSLVFITQSRV
jgi:uncharacterized membrane protein